MIYKFFHHRWRLAIKTAVIVLVILIIKFCIHALYAEFLTLNSLFSALVSATIFLIGFLISGTLSDYKESERLPSEVSASVETLFDEGLSMDAKKIPGSRAYLEALLSLSSALLEWFHHTLSTEEMMRHIRALNEHFLAFEPHVPANFIVRLRQEQHQLRKNILRIHLIRSTRFLSAGYVIAEIISILLILSLMLVHIEPLVEGFFFAGFISYIVCYMMLFIHELDNPFDYANEHRLIEDISLQPIAESKDRLKALLSK